MAHVHFETARSLRPDGMLYKQIEDKPERALPLFLKAIENWDAIGDEDKKHRHQERKNFVTSLYQAAGCHLKRNRLKHALVLIRRCLIEDEGSNHINLVIKYFALGKINFQMNRFTEAKEALLFALHCKAEQPLDFVYDLLSRTYLAMNDLQKALQTVRNVPEKRRRPYICWSEADILCAIGRYERQAVFLQNPWNGISAQDIRHRFGLLKSIICSRTSNPPWRIQKKRTDFTVKSGEARMMKAFSGRLPVLIGWVIWKRPIPWPRNLRR